MQVKNASGSYEELGLGEVLTVTFDRTARMGRLCGFHQGYRVIASPDVCDIRRGETWLCEEILRFGPGADVKKEPRAATTQDIHWGGVVYVWPLRKLS